MKTFTMKSTHNVRISIIVIWIRINISYLDKIHFAVNRKLGNQFLHFKSFLRCLLGMQEDHSQIYRQIWFWKV